MLMAWLESLRVGKGRTRREAAIKIDNLDGHAMVIVTFRFFEDSF
jgi:hypothetical protein